MSQAATPTAAARIQPFWERIPETLAYPMQSNAIMTLFVLTLVKLATLFPSFMLGIMINTIVNIALFRYASECLLTTSHSDMKAPPYSMQIGEAVAVKHLILQFVLMITAILVGVFGNVWAGLILGLLFAYILPAAIILLTMTRSLREALNPAAWFETISLIGGAYVLLALFCMIYFAIGIAASVYFALASGGGTGGFVGELLSWFAMSYVILASFHLMGYVVYQYADQLGHQVKSDELPRNMRNLRADPDQELIDQTQAISDAGDNAKARAQLLEHMSSRGATTLAHEHYRKLVKKDQDKAALIDHGKRFVAVLAAQGNDKRAVEVYAETLALDNGFRPEIPDEVFRLANRATMLGQHKLAIYIAHGFAQRYPKHEQALKNTLLSARIMCEKLSMIKQAAELIRYAEQKWPEHPQKGELLAVKELVWQTANIHGLQLD
ncbi:hypothetical protein C7S18_06870 [Ahniella affigens]|uniref:Uncharacterized protein n=1 Tax=Ahniella affigens TaxID=2021234 RepID=A0A2P1PQ15_9GAMM|nr:DUF4013 domain-containing protein [Ahniella affigens]AVP96937.1 hypothetical protein C7S18_06870 [Ahniella affigens]